MRLAAKAISLPPLSDDVAWHGIIAAQTIEAFTPEQIIQAYDTRTDLCSKVVIGYIEDYLLGLILKRLRSRFGRDEDELTFKSECKSKAFEICSEAISNSEHTRFGGLRLHFHKTISYIFDDVTRTIARNFRRFPRSSNLQSEEAPKPNQDKSKELLEEKFDTQESQLIREIDRDEAMRILTIAFRTTKHLQLIYDLTMDGKTQPDIANQLGLSDRHVRRLQNKILEILSEPDME